MFGLLKSHKEKELGLKNFSKWGRKIDASRRNPQATFIAHSQMLAEYNKLNTPEQKLYAAYISLDSVLIGSIKQELALVSREDRRKSVQIIYDILEEQGKHGCSSLLQGHYKNDV